MKKRSISILILIVSIIFIGIGVFLDQPVDVMNKAIRICLECVGIG